ncbi:glycosyltransferase family 1 protein [Bacillus infantis]|uniref:glycosyltransferase family 4 protein n=1 Tax=Bacillus infantis TaxID=324767 RepID=UPI00101D8147|nr:glycosyltransferase family 4 protein [Bacillus infantis]RYI28776.1 glycosyltransferase family 1 protein [Bacillus infantis]
MKKNVCMIGPLPPPMNGNSKALDTILKSEKCNQFFDFKKVNLAGSQTGMSGKFTYQKFKTLFKALDELKSIQKNNKVNTYYVTTAQSTAGSLRDIALLHCINKNHDDAKVILHLHGGGFQKFYRQANPLLRKVLKNYYSKADNLIVLSESLKSMFNGIAAENKIKVIENCVDDEFILEDNQVEKKLLSLKTKPTIEVVYLSNMIKTKGYYDVLLSARELFKKGVNCKFAFAGNFVNKEQKEEFLQYIQLNNLESYVEYLGVVEGEDKKRLLMRGDIFILPTYYPPEGQPISILEAMGAGMSIITTRHGGIPDVVSEEENGVFVEARNIQNISETIFNLVNDRESMLKMGKNNREKILTNFLEINYISNMIKILDN